MIFLSSFNLNAQHQFERKKLAPIQTDRPDQTESPFTVPKGLWQFEIGTLMETHTINETNKIRNFLYPTILSKVGITRNTELRFITEYAGKQNEINGKKAEILNGIKPITVGLKTKLADEKKYWPTTSLILHLGLSPLASNNFKPNYFYPQFRFLMQHTISNKLNFGYNLGMEWDGNSSVATAIYTTTMAYALTDNLGAFIESYGYLPQKNKSDHRIDGGFTYLLKNNLQADISGGLGISPNAPDYFISCGISIRSSYTKTTIR